MVTVLLRKIEGSGGMSLTPKKLVSRAFARGKYCQVKCGGEIRKELKFYPRLRAHNLCIRAILSYETLLLCLLYCEYLLLGIIIEEYCCLAGPTAAGIVASTVKEMVPSPVPPPPS